MQICWAENFKKISWIALFVAITADSSLRSECRYCPKIFSVLWNFVDYRFKWWELQYRDATSCVWYFNFVICHTARSTSCADFQPQAHYSLLSINLFYDYKDLEYAYWLDSYIDSRLIWRRSRRWRDTFSTSSPPLIEIIRKF